MRNMLSLLLLAILAGMGLYFASPYYATWRLEQAAKSGDAAAVAKVTDFPAVRANLTPHLGAALQTNIEAEGARPRSLLDRVGMAVAPMLQAKPGEALMTPRGLTLMLKTAAPPNYAGPFHQDREADDAHPGDPYTINQGYVDNDYDQFHIAIGNRLKSDGEVTVRLMRRGFLGWRVTAVDLQATGTAARAQAAAASDKTD